MNKAAPDPATMFVMPSDGRRVRCPDGALLNDGGQRVWFSTYWQRRLADGDVAIAPEKETAK